MRLDRRRLRSHETRRIICVTSSQLAVDLRRDPQCLYGVDRVHVIPEPEHEPHLLATLRAAKIRKKLRFEGPIGPCLVSFLKGHS